MSKYIGPIKWLGGIALGMFVFAFLFGNIAPGLVTEETRNGVLFNAIPFFGAFVGILLLFILLIVTVAIRFNGKIPGRTYSTMEKLIIAGIVFGTACLFNPWSFVPYRYGFLLLLASTLSFIVWSHVLPPRTDFDARVPPLTSMQHIVGGVVAVLIILGLTFAAASVNSPKEPYGIRERVWNSYDEERRAQIAAEATAEFSQVELPFLVIFNAFPAAAAYLVVREVVGGRRAAGLTVAGAAQS